jgi:hypothetical protein
VTSQVDFTPVMTTTAGASQNWLNMVALLDEQLFPARQRAQ